MSYARVATALGIAIALALPSATHAQQAASTFKLVPGVWTGIIVPPGSESTDVSYNVSYNGDTVAIEIDAGQNGKFAVEDIQVSASRITFAFTPGPRVSCALDAADKGSFGGECVEEDGSTAIITMSPPKPEPKQ